MAKDPATLWYWNDWHSGTVTLTRHLKGCYMDLLHAQFNNGRLSLDEIKTVLGSDFGNSWPTIQKKFEKDDNGLFFNRKAEETLTKRKAFTESRRSNLKKKEPPHMEAHMEIVNVNVNVLNRQNVYESLRRATPKSLSDARIDEEVSKFINYYSGKELKNIGSACNNWAANIKTDEKKMVL